MKLIQISFFSTPCSKSSKSKNSVKKRNKHKWSALSIDSSAYETPPESFNSIKKMDQFESVTKQSDAYQPQAKPLKSRVFDHKIKSKVDKSRILFPSKFTVDHLHHEITMQEYDDDDLIRSNVTNEDRSPESLESLTEVQRSNQCIGPNDDHLVPQPNDLDKDSKDDIHRNDSKTADKNDDVQMSDERPPNDDSNKAFYQAIHNVIGKGYDLKNMKKKPNEFSDYLIALKTLSNKESRDVKKNDVENKDALLNRGSLQSNKKLESNKDLQIKEGVQSRAHSKDQSTDRSRSQSRDQSKGNSRDQSRAHSKDQSRGNSRDRSKDQSRGNSRDRSRGNSVNSDLIEIDHQMVSGTQDSNCDIKNSLVKLDSNEKSAFIGVSDDELSIGSISRTSVKTSSNSSKHSSVGSMASKRSLKESRTNQADHSGSEKIAVKQLEQLEQQMTEDQANEDRSIMPSFTNVAIYGTLTTLASYAFYYLMYRY